MDTTGLWITYVEYAFAALELLLLLLVSLERGEHDLPSVLPDRQRGSNRASRITNAVWAEARALCVLCTHAPGVAHEARRPPDERPAFRIRRPPNQLRIGAVHHRRRARVRTCACA